MTERNYTSVVYLPTSNSAADAEGTNPNIAAAILRAAVTMRLTFLFFYLFIILYIRTFILIYIDIILYYKHCKYVSIISSRLNSSLLFPMLVVHFSKAGIDNASLNDDTIIIMNDSHGKTVNNIIPQ